MIYCLSAQLGREIVEDGEMMTRRVLDKNGDSHWIAWPIIIFDKPRLCSSSPSPFAESLEPYSEDTR
jgi:hypothetical protein